MDTSKTENEKGGADSSPQPEREQTVQVKKEKLSSTKGNASTENVDVIDNRFHTSDIRDIVLEHQWNHR